MTRDGGRGAAKRPVKRSLQSLGKMEKSEPDHGEGRNWVGKTLRELGNRP